MKKTVFTFFPCSSPFLSLDKLDINLGHLSLN